MHFRCNAHYHYILVHEKKKLRMRDIPPNFFKDNKVKSSNGKGESNDKPLCLGMFRSWRAANFFSQITLIEKSAEWSFG